MNEWLQTLKPGDQVIEYVRAGFSRIVKVQRVTKIKITIESGRRYKKSDGRTVVPEYGYCNRLRQATPELVEEVLKDNLIREIATVLPRLRSLDVEKLQQIWDLSCEGEA